MEKWTRVNYQPNLPLGSEGQRVTACTQHRQLSKEAAKEGMVLLKNDNSVLPLNKGTKVALFGKGTFDYVKGGGGSGDVTVAYTKNMYDGFKELNDQVMVFEPLADFYREHVNNEYSEGKEPGLTTEPELPEELLDRSSAFAETAVISICRFSGEGWDRKGSPADDEIYAEEWVKKYAVQSDELFSEGDFCLSEAEKTMVEQVKGKFKNTIIVLNVGGVVDTQWFVEDTELPAVLMAYQGGMEGGCAAAELICGIGNPSGKLVDTFAKSLQDYPSTANYHESMDYVDYTDDVYVGYRYFETIPGASEKVNYPFGYGLSYTTFRVVCEEVEVDGESFKLFVKVTNVGEKAGKEVVQVYNMPEQGLLDKPAKSLIAFKKTRLLEPGDSQLVVLNFTTKDLASYDDCGVIQKSAYVLEKGQYKFFVGTSVRDGEIIAYAYDVEEHLICEQLTEKLKATSLSKRLKADGTYETLAMSEANDPNETVLDRRTPDQLDGYMPQVRPIGRRHVGGDDSIFQLIDVWEGKKTMDEFIAQLSDEALIHLLGGQPNVGVANTWGFGNLPEYGVPSIMTADGPAGLRINKECGVTTTAWPCSTLLASTWNEEIVYEVGEAGAKEVKENNIAVWLTPAVNIHRSPLCGRNFEYYSEDPFVSGKLAAAMVKGIQSMNIAPAVKHFAMNNKETNRKNSDSRVTERAAREIYLKAFEIIVKEADPWCIMSAYNMINGYRTSESKELLEDILRDEWGFSGAVTTDWWTYAEHYKEVKAGNDIKMGCGFPERLEKAMELGVLTRADLEHCAKRVLTLICRID